MTTIAVLVGSLQKNSLNKNLAHALEALKPEGTTFDYVNIDLPLFNQDLEADYPAAAREGKDKIEAADGVLVVTPEYNRSVPGVLKNAIDWFSRPWGTNSFKGKPTGLVGASGSPVGTALSQADLHQVMNYLEAKLLTQPEIYMAGAPALFDEQGNLTDEHWRENLKTYIDTLVAHIEKNK